MSLQSLAETAKAQSAQVPDAINALTEDPESHQRAKDLVTLVETSARGAALAASRTSPRATVSLLAANVLAQTATGLLDLLDEISASGSTPELLAEAKNDADELVTDANYLAQESMGVGGRRRKTRKTRKGKSKRRRMTRRR